MEALTDQVRIEALQVYHLKVKLMNHYLIQRQMMREQEAHKRKTRRMRLMTLNYQLHFLSG